MSKIKEWETNNKVMLVISIFLIIVFIVAISFVAYGKSKDVIYDIEGTTVVKAYRTEGRVTIPEEITTIGSKAFWERQYMYELNLYNVNKIGDKAFMNCYGLSDVKMGSDVEIGKDAFLGCVNLHEITLPKAYNSEEALKNIGIDSTKVKITYIG